MTIPQATPDLPPLPKGDKNENPPGIGMLELLAEDFRTYDQSLLEPGFWAVAVHRFGNWRMGLKPKLLRAPCTLLYRTLATSVNWGFGIKLDYTVKLGRRVRIWHHGGMILGARSIGDDVHIRQNTTFGVAHKSQPLAKPVIGDRVDIGCGAAILGQVRVEHDAVIGANAVVVRDVPAHSLVIGVPGRIVKKLATEQATEAPRHSVLRYTGSNEEGQEVAPKVRGGLH
jgi:serine O-acetyltransferase